DWAKRTSGTSANLYAVTWTGSAFVAVGAGGAMVTSGDGVAWTVSTALSAFMSSLSYTGNIWGVAANATASFLVAVGSNQNGDGVIFVSQNGRTSWTTSAGTSFAGPLHAVTWVSGNTFVAVGAEGAGGNGNI